MLLNDINDAIKSIKKVVSKGELGDHLGLAGDTNIQGEDQKKLDVLSDEIFIKHSSYRGLVAAMASEEQDEIIVFNKTGKFLVVFDPLDGSSNIDINMTTGSIFSILRYENTGNTPTNEDFLKKGNSHIVAGFSVYGPSNTLTLTLGKGAFDFVLDEEMGEFIAIDRPVKINEDTSEFAINQSNERFWDRAISEYIKDCKSGKTGPRQRDFNMRWVASMVSEAQRVLKRTGIYLYPKNNKEPQVAGRLRLLYEAIPIAFIMQQSGGLATDGRTNILDIKPESIHQRIPLVFGSKNEVLKVGEYYKNF